MLCKLEVTLDIALKSGILNKLLFITKDPPLPTPNVILITVQLKWNSNIQLLKQIFLFPHPRLHNLF
jgi:hypothetical protein